MTTLDELGSLDSPYRSTRYPATDRLFTLLDEERVTPGQVIDMLVNYLSEDEIAEMLEMNEL